MICGAAGPVLKVCQAGTSGRCVRAAAVTRSGIGGTDFEHKLKVKRLVGLGRPSIFTESLILAQDERWRRA